MDYEKKYKEALERVEQMVADAQVHQEVIEQYFPELKESREKKIRKSLIMLLQHFCKGYRVPGLDFPVPYNDMLDWLEKQGTSYTKKDVDDAYLKGISDTKNEIEKQYEANYQIRKDIATFIFNYRGDIKDRAKWMNYLGIKVSFIERQGEKPQGKSALEGINDKGYCCVVKKQDKSAFSYHEEKVDNANKVEPKFKIGQWIVWQDKCYKVNYNVCGYELVDQNGLSTSLEYGTIDENAHIWDIIKDAKDGDVLANDYHILILKELDYNWGDDGTPSAVKAYCGIKPNGNFETGKDNWCFCGTLHIHPATKEQRELLFQKIEEAGYKWDADKRKLIKL